MTVVAPAPGHGLPIASNGAAAWQAARRILAVRLDNLGDVLMTTPAISALAAADPPRHVTLLASRAGAAVAGHVPALDDVLVYDAPWVKGPSRSGQADRRFMVKLAQRRFDAAVIFTVSTQSALPAATLCRMAGIPLRLAYSRENPYALLTDWLRDDEVCGDGMRHEVERQLALVRSVGFESPSGTSTEPRLVFRSSPAEVQSVRSAISRAGGNPLAPYIVVHPGSSAASRRYPAERFGKAAARIARASGMQIVFAGGPDEMELVGTAQAAMAATAAAGSGGGNGHSLGGHSLVADLHVGRSSTGLPPTGPSFGGIPLGGVQPGNGPPSNVPVGGVPIGNGLPGGISLGGISLAGRLSIGELGALIAGARIVICNNSGPAHLAAAAGKPVVVLYALTNPQHTPWRVPSRVLNRDVPCRNCQKSVCPQVHHRCLLGVEPEEVAAAALDLLHETEPTARTLLLPAPAQQVTAAIV